MLKTHGRVVNLKNHSCRSLRPPPPSFCIRPCLQITYVAEVDVVDEGEVGVPTKHAPSSVKNARIWNQNLADFEQMLSRIFMRLWEIKSCKVVLSSSQYKRPYWCLFKKNLAQYKLKCIGKMYDDFMYKSGRTSQILAVIL